MGMDYDYDIPQVPRKVGTCISSVGSVVLLLAMKVLHNGNSHYR